MIDGCRIPCPPRTSRFAWGLALLGAVLVLLSGRGLTVAQEVLGPDRSHEAGSIDVLEATPAELEFLPGIGPGLARSIHRELRLRGIRSLDELESLRGIGPSRANAIRGAIMKSSGE